PQRAMLAAGQAVLRFVRLRVLAQGTSMRATNERIRRDDLREEVGELCGHAQVVVEVAVRKASEGEQAQDAVAAAERSDHERTGRPPDPGPKGRARDLEDLAIERPGEPGVVPRPRDLQDERLSRVGGPQLQ